MEIINEKLKIDHVAPNFCLQDQNSIEFCPLDLRGRWIIINFYSKDDLVGFIKDLISLNQSLDKFSELNASVVAISPDSVDLHKNITKKYNIRFPILSDITNSIASKYGVWNKRKAITESSGVVRTSVLLDPTNAVRCIWEDFQPENHVENLVMKLEELNGPVLRVN